MQRIMHCMLPLVFKKKEERLLMMGFRTCNPKIWHLGIMNTLRRRNLRKGRAGRSLTFLHPFPLKQVIKPTYERCLPIPRGMEHQSSSPKTKELQEEPLGLAKFPSVYSITPFS